MYCPGNGQEHFRPQGQGTASPINRAEGVASQIRLVGSATHVGAVDHFYLLDRIGPSVKPPLSLPSWLKGPHVARRTLGAGESRPTLHFVLPQLQFYQRFPARKQPPLSLKNRQFPFEAPQDTDGVADTTRTRPGYLPIYLAKLRLWLPIHLAPSSRGLRHEIHSMREQATIGLSITSFHPQNTRCDLPI